MACPCLDRPISLLGWLLSRRVTFSPMTDFRRPGSMLALQRDSPGTVPTHSKSCGIARIERFHGAAAEHHTISANRIRRVSPSWRVFPFSCKKCGNSGFRRQMGLETDSQGELEDACGPSNERFGALFRAGLPPKTPWVMIHPNLSFLRIAVNLDSSLRPSNTGSTFNQVRKLRSSYALWSHLIALSSSPRPAHIVART